MLTPYNEFKNFCRITANGLEVSSYAEIRNSLITKYKQIYGVDIDLSDASADGQWIAEQALIYNNMCQTLKLMYAQLNPNTASGSFLEMICSFSNVYRRAATYSTASLVVRFDTTSTFSSLDFLDANGTIWSWSDNEGQTFEANTDYNIQVVCSQVGPVTAPAGSITKPVTSYTGLVSVSQPSDANVGTYKESDADLRARRNRSLAQSSTTVNEGLIGSLLTMQSIQDVKIYDKGIANTAADGTEIAAHSVYIITKVTEGQTLDDKDVGNIIYQMMTPGILTTESEASTTSTHHSYTYQVTDDISKTVYWKQAANISPTGTIVLTIKDYWSNSTVVNILNAFYALLSKQPIGKIPSNFEILNELQSADPLYRGQSTYVMDSVTINNASSIQQDNAVKGRVITDISEVSFAVVGSTLTITLS